MPSDFRIKPALLLIGAVLITPAGFAAAQASGASTQSSGTSKSPPTSRSGPTLRPIEAGVGDLGPLATSTRELRVDLRQPAGFDRVYQLPGQQRAGQGAKAGDFVRFDSGVAAVFPRSQYVMTSRGLMPQVPAGTTFYIGKLPDSVVQAGAGTKATPSLLRIDRGVDMSAREARPQATPGETRVSTRVDMRANADAAAQPQAAGEPASILSDAKARERWIDGLGSGKK